MAEYWKSTPKYWCKHCSIFVKDTPFERKQHESTGKHQGNLKRVLRGIQNDHERNERDKQRAKQEVDRLNKVVGGSSESSGIALSVKSSAIRATGAATASTATDQKRQWAQLAEMGIQVPDSARAEMAQVGDWQTVSEQIVEEAPMEGFLSKGIKKRKYDDEDEQEEKADGSIPQRGWGSTTRHYPGEIDDNLESLFREPLVKKDAVSESKAEPASIGTDDKPQSTRRALSPEMNPIADAIPSTSITSKAEEDDIKLAIKKEDTQSDAAAMDASIGTPDLNPVPVFKKRKAKAR